MKEILESFEKSLHRLEDVLQDKKTVKTRDASIKRFEFTVELAWKSAQKFLRKQEIVCRSPKECLREAFKFGLAADDARWVQMFEDRNLTAHTYDEETADEVYNRLPSYLAILNGLKEKLMNERPEKTKG